MGANPLFLAILFGTLVVAFGVWAVWRHAQSERERWTRYNRPRGEGPKSWVCPTCLTRHYGAKAIEEKRCRVCEEARAAE